MRTSETHSVLQPFGAAATASNNAAIDLKSRRSVAPSPAVERELSNFEGPDPATSGSTKVSASAARVMVDLDRILRGLRLPAPDVLLAQMRDRDIAGPALPASSATEAWIAGLLLQHADQTIRADADRLQIQLLEAQLGADQEAMATLGRRFGQGIHEPFFSFVARLAMTARPASIARIHGPRSAEP
jgi:hypothetical protein